jgi:hypothetical protein
VPEADNFNPFALTLEPVDNAIRTADDFAKVPLPEFRHHAAHFRKTRQTFGAGDQVETEAGGGIGIMGSYVADDLRQLGSRRRTDGYLPAHPAIMALTFSMGIPSPRSSSSGPCWTAWRNSSSFQVQRKKVRPPLASGSEPLRFSPKPLKYWHDDHG